MSKNMVERVARALVASDEIVISAPPNPHEGCACMGAAPGEPACRCVMAAARVATRAAIEAMREPTEAMVEAAHVAEPNPVLGGYALEEDGPGTIWNAMITAALKP